MQAVEGIDMAKTTTNPLTSTGAESRNTITFKIHNYEEDE